jgi:exopolyphosphatase/guanosine-5'-triphosphate,3'-diphosphate pyrophosphatase
VGLEVGGAVSVFDVGGGSLEMVHGVADAHGARVVAARSLDVGSVRLTERCLRSDPPARDELAQVCEHARDALRDVPAPPAAATWVGIAGTVTTLASVSLGMASYDGARVHGSALRRTDVAQLLERLAAMPLAARREVKGLEPKRADVIVAGACIVREVLDWAQAAQMLVSDRGVRWGLALELARAR